MENGDKNLYQVWNQEGEPNTEALAILHDFHIALKDESRFVGVVPFGSNFKGDKHTYNKQNSDVDVVILFTSNQVFNYPVDAPSSVLKEMKAGSFGFLEKVTNIRDALQMQYGKTINILTQIVEPFTYKNDSGIEKINYFAVARIAQLVTGESASPLRQKVKEFFHTQNQETQEIMLDQVLSVLADEDKKSTPKMLERKIFQDESEARDWVKQRKILWHERLREMFI